ncbi:MAG: NAD(P)/FAD-dependent oxidoreductase [Erysipelotrichaceae bacterium]|nr:NAD(P)/FAD-dependent oxidoreductase [Erysipelotrichaceae bacterium]
MSNIIIIGSGPAGVSASLYTQRANIDTLVIAKGHGALEKAEEIENYYGIMPVSGLELEANGIAAAKEIGVKFLEAEVVGISYGEKFMVETTSGVYEADALIIATGSVRKTLNVKGLRNLEGKGVSYCAICDAFFYRQKDVCVLGSGEYAAHEIAALLPVVNSLTLLTNGESLTTTFDERVKIIDKKISSIDGENKVESVSFEDGSKLAVDGVFVAYGSAGSTALAKKIGASIDGNKIVVDENMATSIPGIFAAGDCTGGLLQVAKAVYEGAKAGTEAIKFLRKK